MATDTPLDIRYWATPHTGGGYPEQDDPELGYAPAQQYGNTGICFSGGGTISVSLIAGYLKALRDLGLLDKVGYFSGVSGGAWGTAPFCFLPPGESEARLLGPKYMPEALTRRRLRWNRKGSITHLVTHAQIANRTVLNGRFGYEAFSRAVGEIFLRPVGIPSPPTRKQKARFFSTTPEAVQHLCARNPALQPHQFVTLRPHRPYWIANGVMFVPKTEASGENREDFHALPFEFTPLYNGSRVRYPHAGKEDQAIGGSWVETLGFNASEVPHRPENGHASVRLKRPFELSDSLGTTGAAIAQLLVEFDIPLKLLFPQYNYWNPGTGHPPQRYEFGDGGIIENLGIIPLLGRKVKNIVVLSTEPFDTEQPLHRWDFSERAERQFGYNQIAALFGQPTYDLDPRSKTHQQLRQSPHDRQVFAAEEFAQVQEGLQRSKAAGGPAHYLGTHRVQQNDFFGVEGDWECRVLWMCVDTATAWEKRLPERIRKRLGRIGPLHTFPILRIFGQNLPHVIQLTRVQANLLGNLAYWMVMDRQDAFKSLLAPSEANPSA